MSLLLTALLTSSHPAHAFGGWDPDNDPLTVWDFDGDGRFSYTLGWYDWHDDEGLTIVASGRCIESAGQCRVNLSVLVATGDVLWSTSNGGARVVFAANPLRAWWTDNSEIPDGAFRDILVHALSRVTDRLVHGGLDSGVTFYSFTETSTSGNAWRVAIAAD